MKKLMYGGLFLVLVGVGIFACRKENLNPASTTLQTKDVSNVNQKNDLSSPSEKSTGNGDLDSIMNNSKNPYNDLGKEFYDFLVNFVSDIEQNSLDNTEVHNLITNSIIKLN